jgi:hypothetical protein
MRRHIYFSSSVCIDLPANVKALNLLAQPVPEVAPLEATDARVPLSQPSERKPEGALDIPIIVRAFQTDAYPSLIAPTSD